jgi:hypothetical protein
MFVGFTLCVAPLLLLFTLCVAPLILLFSINSQQLFEVAATDITAFVAATHRVLATFSMTPGLF